ITLVHKPFKYELKPATGDPGSTATLTIDGERFDHRRLYRFPDMDVRLVPVITENVAAGTLRISQSPSELATLGRLAAMFASQSGALINEATVLTAERGQNMQQRLESDIQSIEEVNAQLNQTNERVLPLLQTLTSQNLGADPSAWKK